MRFRYLLPLTGVFLPALALAQPAPAPGISRSGAFTTGHCLQAVAPNAAADSGAACGGGGAVSITAGNAGITVSPSPITGTGTIALSGSLPVALIVSTANGNAILVPNGTGGTQGHAVTTTALGSHAVDWQSDTSGANVASGQDSTIAGGQNGSATGSYSTVCGGTSNHATGNYSVVCGGNSSTASGQGAVALGGVSNSVSGTASIALAGQNNSSVGGTNEVAAGSSQTMSGTSSMALGNGHTSSGGQTLVTGTYGNDFGQTDIRVQASSVLFHYHEVITAVFWNGTNTASATRLAAQAQGANASNTLGLTNNIAGVWTAQLVARDTVSGGMATFTVSQGAFLRGASAASTTMSGSFTAGPTLGTIGAIATLPTCSADTTNGSFNCQFTPPAGNTDQINVTLTIKLTITD